MDWNDIRLIAEIARTGSFSAAAEVLGISKPTVSRRVAFLEQTAKAKIFRRGPHGASLTATGEQLVRHAAPIRDAAVDFGRVLRSMGSGGRPLITARMTEGVRCSYLITPALTGTRLGPLGQSADRLRTRLPAMRLLPMTTAESTDISLIWKSSNDAPECAPTDKVCKLADIRFVPFHGGDYGQKRRAINKFSELRHHQLVTLHAYRSLFDDDWEDWNDLISRGRRPRPSPSNGRRRWPFTSAAAPASGCCRHTRRCTPMDCCGSTCRRPRCTDGFGCRARKTPTKIRRSVNAFPPCASCSTTPIGKTRQPDRFARRLTLHDRAYVITRAKRVVRRRSPP